MLTKHDERKMPKNRGHIASLARSYTDTAIKTLAGIMMEPNSPPMARVAAAKVLLDRGWGKCSETHNINLDGETSLLKVVNEIVHVHETREQIEFRDQTPLLELTPEDTEHARDLVDDHYFRFRPAQRFRFLAREKHAHCAVWPFQPPPRRHPARPWITAAGREYTALAFDVDIVKVGRGWGDEVNALYASAHRGMHCRRH